MVGPQLGQVGERLVERMRRVEVRLGRGRVRPDQVVVVVRGDLAREHVLPRVLVAAVAGEALLVAVVDDRAAAGEVHQRVGELVARRAARRRSRPRCRCGGSCRSGPCRGCRGRSAGCRRSSRRRCSSRRRRRTPRSPVVAEPGREGAGPALEGEVEHGLELRVLRVARREGGIRVEDLAEHEEVVDPLARGVLHERRRPLLPELVVDVLDRVDPVAVDADVGDPGRVDVDHPLDDLGPLGEEVVEAEEVAVERVLADEGRVAAVVVHGAVVQPGGHLHGRVRRRREDGRVGEALEVQCREVVRAGVVGVVELEPVGVPVGLLGLGDVVVGALRVVDHVGGVVRDDVEEDLDPARVRAVDQRRAAPRSCRSGGRAG